MLFDVLFEFLTVYALALSCLKCRFGVCTASPSSCLLVYLTVSCVRSVLIVGCEMRLRVRLSLAVGCGMRLGSPLCGVRARPLGVCGELSCALWGLHETRIHRGVMMSDLSLDSSP